MHGLVQNVEDQNLTPNLPIKKQNNDLIRIDESQFVTLS